MRHALARVVMLLSIVLTLANAACFARCLAQTAEHHPAPPCHSQHKSQTVTQQHDMQPSAAATVAAPVSPVPLPAMQLAEGVLISTSDQPPATYDTSPLPLRI